MKLPAAIVTLLLQAAMPHASPYVSISAQQVVERQQTQTKQGLRLTQETQERGYWVDPSTGLMWAAKDNGSKEVNWHQAMKYCRDLRLAGYSDWRLATIDELEGIYDESANSPGENPRSRWHEAEPMSFHVKGGLFLRGNQWSSTQRRDDSGHPYGYAWRFDFNQGRRFGGDELWFYTNKHALCVRGSKESLPLPSEPKRPQ